MSAISYVWCNACDRAHAPGEHNATRDAILGVANLGYDKQREYNQAVSAATDAVERPKRVTPLQESLVDAQRIAGLMVEQMQELAARVEKLQAERDHLELRSRTLQQQFEDFTKVNAGWEQEHVIWRNDRRHVIAVLDAFVRAPISISSLQPVLTLAQELGCGLRRDE